MLISFMAVLIVPASVFADDKTYTVTINNNTYNLNIKTDGNVNVYSALVVGTFEVSGKTYYNYSSFIIAFSDKEIIALDGSVVNKYGDYYYSYNGAYSGFLRISLTAPQQFVANTSYQINCGKLLHNNYHIQQDLDDFALDVFCQLFEGKEIGQIEGLTSNDCYEYDMELNPPSNMNMTVIDYCTRELKGSAGNNDNVILTFTMYPDDYYENSVFNTHIALYYDVPIYLNLDGMDYAKWKAKHPFTSRYQTKRLKLEFDYELQPNEIKNLNERKEKYDFVVKIPKEEIYEKMKTAVLNLNYKDCKKWVINEKENKALNNGIFTYETFIPCKKVETKNFFYLPAERKRTPFFYLDTTMKLYTNNDVLYTTDGVTSNKTVGEGEIFDYTDKEGNNTPWADSVDFDPAKVLENESGYSWDSSSNHKNFIGILLDLMESIREFPHFMREMFFYLPDFFFTLLGVVLTVIIVMRILGR